MGKPVILGIDLSTHGVKVLAVNQQGQIQEHADQTYDRIIGLDGSQIQPLEPMTAALISAIRQITAALTNEWDIVGLSITHQRGTVIGLDADGNQAVPTVCDSDTRSWPQALFLQAKYGNQGLVALTGCPPVPFNGLTKMMWWYQNHPEMAENVSCWMSVQDWAIWKLSGTLASHPGSALRMGVLDIQTAKRYARWLLEEVDVPLRTLPELKLFDQPIAVINHNASQQTGLAEGIPIFPAPGDLPAAMLGTGAIASYDAVINLGTSFVISFVTDSRAVTLGDLSATLEVLPDGRFTLEYGEGAGTNVLDWLRTSLFDLPSVQELNDLCEKSPCGARGVFVVPHWWAIMDNKRSGVFSGLHSYHNRADLVRATYEGLAYELCYAWLSMENVVKKTPTTIALCGGAAYNDFLCQTIASVLGRPVYRTATKEASAMGAMISAAVGCGWAASLNEAAINLTHHGSGFIPNEKDMGFYKKSFETYLYLRSSLAPKLDM